MTKMKPLSQRDIRDLTSLRIQRGLWLPDLAKELGIAERTLSRYFEGTLPRNNEKGHKVYTKLRELLKEFRASKSKDSPPSKTRKKRLKVSEVLLSDDQVCDIRKYMRHERILYREMATRLGISEGHLLSVVRQEDKASIKLRDSIVALITKKVKGEVEHSSSGDEIPEPAEDQSDRDTPLSEVYTHEFRLRSDFVLKVDLPTNLTLEEAGRISDFIQLIVLD